MDGDGDIDVATVGSYLLAFDWFENDGHGNFTRHEWKPEPLISQTIIGIADYDGDGRQDVWLMWYDDDADHKRRYRYLVAKGRVGGGFELPILVAETPYHSNSESFSLVADFNGDGFTDILGSRFVFLGNQARSFAAPTPIHPDIDLESSWRIKVHDYDSDGDLDLFTGDYRYSENTGNGQFAAPKVFFNLPPDLEINSYAFVHSEINGSPPRLVVLVENDETNDQKLFLYAKQSDGTSLKVDEITLPKAEGQDSRNWWFVRPEPSSTRTFLCNLSGNFIDGGKSQLHELKYGAQGFAIKLLSTHQDFTSFDFTGEADLNGDGFKDLVVMIPWILFAGSAEDHILWYSGKVDGSFQEAPATVVAPAYERRLQVADDFDGDGDVDLMFGLISSGHRANDVSRIAVWSNDGNGIDFKKKTFAVPGKAQSVLGVEDFVTQSVNHGDPATALPFVLPSGRKDFIIRADHSIQGASAGLSEVYLAFQSSEGEFHVKSVASEASNSRIYYADWDGDGARDLLFYDWRGALSWSKRTGYQFGHRQQIMVFPIDSPYSPQPSDFALLDMDRDGDLDIYGRGSLFGPNTAYWAERGAGGEILSFRKINIPLNLLLFDADGDGIREATALLGNSGGIHPVVDFHFENTDLSSFDHNFWGLFDFDSDGDFDCLLSAPTFQVRGFQRLIWYENQGSGPSFTNGTSVEFAGVELSSRDQFAQKDMDGDGTKDLLVVSGDTALVEWFKITDRKGPQAFDDWMVGQNLTGSSAGPTGDWDMDGRNNWEEFIYGTQAKVYDSAYGREPHIEKTSSGMDFAYTRRKSGGGLDLNYGMQRSRMLNGDWEPWNPVMPPPTSTGSYENIRIPITPGEKAEFFRVKLPDIPE